jgi:hypothetical protein
LVSQRVAPGCVCYLLPSFPAYAGATITRTRYVFLNVIAVATCCRAGFLRSISFSAKCAPSERRCTCRTTPESFAAHRRRRAKRDGGLLVPVSPRFLHRNPAFQSMQRNDIHVVQTKVRLRQKELGRQSRIPGFMVEAVVVALAAGSLTLQQTRGFTCLMKGARIAFV